MARRQTLRHPVTASWSASGSISIDLSNKPQTITGMYLVVRQTTTTSASPGSFNDPWDRAITTLTLSGAGHTYFSFTDMRNPYFHNRHFLESMSPKRPAVIAASQTGTVTQFVYYIHFGTNPYVFNAATGRLDENRWDLSGGIAPSTGGNLSLTGTWGAAAASGSGYTTTAGQLDVYLDCVLPEAGDAPEAYLPRAIPAFLMSSPSLTATTAAFGAQENVPVGSLLHSVTAMTTLGSNTPRSSVVLNSLRLQDVLGGNTVFEFGGNASAAADYLSAELITQLGDGFPIIDDAASIGTFTLGTNTDAGMVHLDVANYAVRGDPLYGLDLRRVGTGSVQIQYGIASVSTTALSFLYRRYDYNLAHPANAGK